MSDFDEVIKSWRAKGWTAEDSGRDVWDYQQEKIDELEANLLIAEKLLSDRSYQFYIEQVKRQSNE